MARPSLITMRILHFADLHVGMENYGKLDPQTGVSSRIGDFLARLDEVTTYALDHDADLVIFAGDAFKTRDPDPTQQREFARRIKTLADRIPVFMLVGNHDIPGMSARATSVDIFNALAVPNILIGHKPGSQVIETKSGPVFLSWMPFPVRNRLLAYEEHRGASVDELDKAVEGIVNNALAAFAQAAAEQAMPRVLVGHFSVTGAAYGSERSVMLGRDILVQKSALADPAWDYVALGHIHKHQNLTENDPGLPPVVYSGSLERIDFGEEVEPKGFCWITLERGATTWELVRVKARPFRTLKIDARDATDPTEAALEKIRSRDLTGAIARVLIRVNEEQETLVRRREIEHALTAQGVANLAGITIDVERATRLPGAGATVEALTPLEWVERFWVSKDKSPERIAKLLTIARNVISDL